MFLSAMLCSEQATAPVRIRNMSVSGALVEAAAVPLPADCISLVRGNLIVGGTVVWAAQGRCGIRFDAVVDVKQWLAPAANSEQLRVDDMVRLVRSGGKPTAPEAGVITKSVSRAGAVETEIVDDLRRASILLSALGDDLSEDMAVIARHGSRLQNIDIVLQTMEIVSLLLSTPAATRGPLLVKLQSLRMSALQAANRGSL